MWLLVTLGVGLFDDRLRLSKQNIFIYLIMLPIFILGGYLNGIWRWKELDKKYSESA